MNFFEYSENIFFILDIFKIVLMQDILKFRIVFIVF